MSKVDKDNQRDLLGGGQEGDDLYMKRGRRAPVITKKNFCLSFFLFYLVTSVSTSIPLLLLAKRKKKLREFKAEMEKSKVTLRKVIQKR